MELARNHTSLRARIFPRFGACLLLSRASSARLPNRFSSLHTNINIHKPLRHPSASLPRWNTSKKTTPRPEKRRMTRMKSSRNAVTRSRTSLNQRCACRTSMELRNAAIVGFISTASRRIPAPNATVFSVPIISLSRAGRGSGSLKANRARELPGLIYQSSSKSSKSRVTFTPGVTERSRVGWNRMWSSS